MSFMRKALKSGLALKAVQVIRREAAKPENQRRAKEMLAKMRDRRAGGQAGGRGRPTHR